MAHQCSADALSLVFVDHSECHLGCPGAHDDITAAANDCAAATIFHHRHQGDMAGEIDIQKEVNFLFGKIASQAEEATIKRPSAGAIHSCDEIGPIARRKRADFNPASVAELFDRRKLTQFCCRTSQLTDLDRSRAVAINRPKRPRNDFPPHAIDQYVRSYRARASSRISNLPQLVRGYEKHCTTYRATEAASGHDQQPILEIFLEPLYTARMTTWS